MIITEAYREQNRKLHETNEKYGTSGRVWREFVRNISDWGRRDILDFGAGKRTLSQSLGPAYRVTDYDPCIPGLDAEPEPHDIVVCGDVMEHVEPELVENVLAKIRTLTKHKAFFVIAMLPSTKTLPDGRNSHLSLHDDEWWREKIEAAGFEIIESKSMRKEAIDRSPGTTWFIAT